MEDKKLAPKARWKPPRPSIVVISFQPLWEPL
jgi:hypothetical protein